MAPTRKSERLKAKPPVETKNVTNLKRKVPVHVKSNPKDAKKRRIVDSNHGKLGGIWNEVPLDVLYEVCASSFPPLEDLTCTRSCRTCTLSICSTSRVRPRCFEMPCSPSPAYMHGPKHLTTLDLTLATSWRTSTNHNLPDFFLRGVVQ